MFAAENPPSFAHNHRSRKTTMAHAPRTLSRLLAALALAFAIPALAQNALDDVLAKKTLAVAIPTDSAPYGFVGTDLQPRGLDIDWPSSSPPGSASGPSSFR
jgi:hypothetical protein